MELFSKVGKTHVVIKQRRMESRATNTSLAFLQVLFFIVFFPVIPCLSRAVSASVRKSVENLSDTLKLLGHRNKEEGWKVFDDIIIQNARNGLVSFKLNEHLER